MATFPTTFSVEFTDAEFLETIDPSLVVARFRGQGTVLATGNRYDQDYISMIETRDGLITRYVDFWNPAGHNVVAGRRRRVYLPRVAA